MSSRRICTLFFLRGEGNRVLLGLKKRGFGTGKWNGFGGKVEPGESLLSAALREVEEECGVTVMPASASYVAYLSFVFASAPEVPLDVHVFCAPFPTNAVIRESDEMAPAWHDIDKLPFHDMWPDDEHWLPLVLSGHNVQASFDFNGLSTITRFVVKILKDGESPCTDVTENSILIPVGTALQSAIDYT